MDDVPRKMLEMTSYTHSYTHSHSHPHTHTHTHELIKFTLAMSFKRKLFWFSVVVFFS